MKLNGEFSFLGDTKVSQDISNLTRFYLPIIGFEAYAIYAYFLAFWDPGKLTHSFVQLSRHLNISLESLKGRIDILSSMGLVDLHKGENTYFIKIYPALSGDDFLKNSFYKSRLESKIGSRIVESLNLENGKFREGTSDRSVSSILKASGTAIGIKDSTVDFDWASFKKRMEKDGLFLTDVTKDRSELFKISAEKKWTWFETYLLAKETAIGNFISTQKMRDKLCQNRVQVNFSKREQQMLREVKHVRPLEFLARFKVVFRAQMILEERRVLRELEDLGLSDEVINILILLTFNKVNSANLNGKYIRKAANDFSHCRIYSAEEAILKIRERENGRILNSTAFGHHKKRVVKTNVPSWSNPDYKNETTSEKLAELDNYKRQLLAKVDQIGE